MIDEQIARLSAADILPARHAGEATAIATPLALLDRWQYGPRHLLVVVADAAGRRFAVPVIEEDGRLRRARAGDGAAAALAGAGSGSGGFDLRRYAPPTDGAGQERAIEVDQTNESTVVADRLVVKWTVRSSATQRTPARLATLSRAGFRGTPRPHAVLQWQPPDGGPHELVATIVDFVSDAEDGWDWAVADLRAHLAGTLELRAATAFAVEVGRLVRDLHAALASDGLAVAEPADSARWRDEALTELDAALSEVDSPALQAHAATVRAALRELALPGPTPIGSAHGDLHIGQILRSGERYVVTDFDGNPVVADNGAAQSPAVDVAGMVQSIDHVGRVVRKHDPSADSGAVQRWCEAAQGAFLASCRSPSIDARLVVPFRFRQVVREYLYAARHLPRWQYVPDAALPELVRQFP